MAELENITPVRSFFLERMMELEWYSRQALLSILWPQSNRRIGWMACAGPERRTSIQGACNSGCLLLLLRHAPFKLYLLGKFAQHESKLAFSEIMPRTNFVN